MRDRATLTHGEDAGRYDRLTIFFHWTTAGLVIVLFLLAQAWPFLLRGTFWRHQLQIAHVSLGILLTAVLIGRLVWRAGRGRKFAPLGLMDRAASGLHHLLYLLLAIQIGLGWLFRWAQGEEFTFFYLFAIPRLGGSFLSPYRSTFAWLHDYLAWIIVGLAGAHAVAALIHHYVLRDDILRRMLPGRDPA